MICAKAGKAKKGNFNYHIEDQNIDEMLQIEEDMDPEIADIIAAVGGSG